MVVCIDDPKMTDQLAEFLLQVQGGFSQGSMKSTVTPKSSILLTSNSKETDRFVIIASEKIVILRYSYFNIHINDCFVQGVSIKGNPILFC